MKLLLWLIILYLGVKYVYPLWQRQKNSLNKAQEPPLEDTQEMVRCAKCGVFVVRQEAVAVRGRYYCSLAHKQQDQSGQ
ncbi:MAG: hypothetical protein B7Z60_00395 [Ferrovum sp. 37-45-19]|uniref:PP0621 family protein n=1 Tax=Ferrovum sp. JA12 TaxID=1356299 RepID=UPI000702F806|nr:PP0621 family protein [Ferrovum sp. JA12]OYV79819.1 MAG: hypothetical protein B7Z65_03685 [Ferrovum sp. 21-44-67]OYV95442.1 MAG: hypothetical protein B7Z60_00395 [Ferrovum sp. 37-45-19]OZB31490.1 MAG: hypothetical protein B7X47_09585 [Ferrovum sp. 34-44-207]HQT81236.1 PP0621 family protein [Ferrovaceae bacterium]KRH78123.1 hypothetical protein FERRO_11030 [Ferrovum sp. JA12]